VSGGTWVLLRGLTRESRHWGAFPARFADRVGAARIVALDLPGNGALHALPSPTRVDAMAAHGRAALQRLGITPPVHLLAMSLGAMVATAWAAAAPGEIGAAVLINTSLRPFSPFHQRLRPANYGRLLRLWLTRADAADWERSVLTMTSRGRGRDDAALLRDWVAYRRECPVRALNALRQLCAAARFRAPLASPFARALLLGSAHDALVDPRCTDALARRWSVEARLHPWAGHDLPLDDAMWVADQVRDWL